MYKALDVAAYIIETEELKDRFVNYLRLNRYLYFLQAQFLVFADKPLFSDKIEAWDCGPMIQTVNTEYRMFGNASIFKPQTSREYIRPDDRSMINQMLDTLSKYSNTALVQIILNQRPWQIANRRLSGDQEITKESLYDFFKEDEDNKPIEVVL